MTSNIMTKQGDREFVDVSSAEQYGDGYPQHKWSWLRQHDPVHYVEMDGYNPFYVISKYDDIVAIEKNPDQWLAQPRTFILKKKLEQGMMSQVKSILNMDAPDHLKYRKLASSWFTPKNLKKFEEDMSDISSLLLDPYIDKGVMEMDFVTEIAQWHPLKMLAKICDIDEADEPNLLKLAAGTFGGEDPEIRGELSKSEFTQKNYEFAFQLIDKLNKIKTENPGNDLASSIMNGVIDGQPIAYLDMFAYILVVITAGHETTRNAISGGLLALINHPDEFQKLKDNPELTASTVEEMIRWTSPVTHFVRTAKEDCEVRGRFIRAGESVALYYPSANRDEEVFENPFEFKIDRSPNPQIGFGTGPHMCLGAQLARMEMVVFYKKLIPLISSLELVGEPEYVQSLLVGGLKHLPIKIQLNK